MNDNLLNPYWSDVKAQLQNARLIAWDTCHKIYIAMDEGQERWYRENYTITGSDFIGGQSDEGVFVGTPDEMLAKLHKWWNASCGLRFISAVWTDDENQNNGFMTLVPQFADAESV